MRKNKILLVGFLISSCVLNAQIGPQGNPPANNVNAQANAAWYRGGNNPVGPAGNKNIFGTAAGFNSPIYTVTNGENRTTLMGFQPPGSITGAFGLGTNLLP